MKTHTTKKAVWTRSLLLLPLFAVLIYSCSNTEELVIPIEEKVLEENSQEIASPEMVSQYNSIARKYASNKDLLPLVEIEDYKKMRQIYDRMSVEQKQAAENFPEVEIITVVEDEEPEEKSATPEMISKYNRLVKYYNSEPKDKLNVKQEDINMIMSILGKMTQEQKAQAEKITFDVPPPPPPPPATAPEVLEQMPPPPPPPPTFEDLVEKGATFYYNGKEIQPEEARKLVEVEKKVYVQITEIKTGEVTVNLFDKKD